MKKKEIIGGVLILTIITALSGYLLAQVYKTTKPAIEKQKKIEEEKVNRGIFPDGVEFIEKEENGVKYFSVLNSKKEEIGKIFTTSSLGYGGYIKIKVGIDKNGKIKGIKILQHNETPGLGAKITEDKFLSQFKGKTAEELYLKKDKSEGRIDAITGATISSRAVTDGVRKLLEKINKKEVRSEN